MADKVFTPEKKFMQRAIELSKQAGIKEKSGGAFGSIVVLNGEIIGEGYNEVVKRNDPTWHGEIAAIRAACQHMGSPHIDGAVLYTSAEPCPLCYAACCWAHIGHIFYAATMEDTTRLGDFTDIDYYEQLALPKGDKKKRIQLSEFMRDEAVKVWEEFHNMPGHVHY